MNAVPVGRRNGEFRLGEWLVRPSLNQLSRGGTVLHLRPKAMDVLVYLAARGGTVVSKDEVIEAIWAKQFLADSALSRAVCELRQALGDEAQRSTYIQTIPKRGYRLITAVRQVEPAMEPAQPRGGAGASPGRWGRFEAPLRTGRPLRTAAPPHRLGDGPRGAPERARGDAPAQEGSRAAVRKPRPSKGRLPRRRHHRRDHRAADRRSGVRCHLQRQRRAPRPPGQEHHAGRPRGRGGLPPRGDGPLGP